VKEQRRSSPVKEQRRSFPAAPHAVAFRRGEDLLGDGAEREEEEEPRETEHINGKGSN